MLEGYKGYSGLKLMDLTHSDDPWRRHRLSEKIYEVIPRSELQDHYRQHGVFGGRPVAINEIDPEILTRARSGDREAFTEALEQGLGVKVQSIGPVRRSR